MYKSIRKKVAASVNSVDAPEQFEWGKWLRASDSESIAIAKIRSSLSGFKANMSLNLPETNSFNFQTKKVKLYKSRKLSTFSKEKTIKVFYKLGKSTTRKIKIFDANSGKIIFSSSPGKNTENPTLLKEINEPFSLNNLNLVRELTDSFALLNSSIPSTSISFQNIKAKVKKVPLIDSVSRTIDIKAKIKQPESKSYYQKINQELLDTGINAIQLFLEKNSSDSIFKPTFIFLNEIPKVDSYEIPNVNQLIEELDRDKSSKKINVIPIQFLSDKPSVKKVKILNSEKPKISVYSHAFDSSKKTITFSNLVSFENNTSTFTYLFQMDRTIILGESFENIFSDYSCENWDIPLVTEDNLLNPEQETENKNDISSAIAITDESEKVDNDDSFEEIISDILKPDVIAPEKIDIDEEFLYNYQKEGAELLASNKVAMLCDEPGLGKTFQAISALNSLYGIGVINKILIVCNKGEIGDISLNAGWVGKLNELSAEISLTIVKREDADNKKLWKENKDVFIINYEDFFKLLSEDGLDSQYFESFNCFIFDEAQNLLPNQKLFNEFWESGRSNSAYTWFLSNQLSLNKRIQKELNFQKNNPIIELARTKTETYRDLPDVVRQDVWHELDDEQKIEYENILSIGRERITKLLQNGNPFIIQSNVFTLLHQLKQIYNFASQKTSSSKTEHLLKQIENIIENDKKMLVFSQYDKMGIQKIEQVLNSNKIKYIILHSGMSLNELEAAKKKFQSNKKIHVLLNGIKSSRSGISLPEVQYVVHFDQWWNPATVWKGEASIIRPKNENITVYNYFTKNTVEEKIKKLLQRKGLLRKEIIEFLSVESINEMVSLDEWLGILGIGNSPENGSPESSDEKLNMEKLQLESKLTELSIDELSKKTEILFSRLGYKNLFLNKGNYEGEVNIIGTMLENNSKIKMVAKCLFSSNIDLETITEYIEALQNDRNLGKNFIIHFNGLEEKLPYRLKKKIILINKDLFTNYLIDFRLI
ncbi:MAG: DEAD/DEAH box helicase [Ignavibacteriaceae bacterium]